MPKPDMPMMGYDEEDGAEPLDEFETELRAALPNEDWTPERVMAMKEAIKICVAQDREGEYGEDKPKKKGGEALALIFGGPKKKGG